jgi:hypothetical protein
MKYPIKAHDNAAVRIKFPGHSGRMVGGFLGREIAHGEDAHHRGMPFSRKKDRPRKAEHED